MTGPVGYKGEHYRFFLSDEGYQNARRSEPRGEIAIKAMPPCLAESLP
ncbi:MAG: DUF5720 family protein [Enterocloster sp.]